MLQSNAKWIYKNKDIPFDDWMDEIENITPLTKQLLAQRGIETKEDAIRFLSPKLEDLYDPENFYSIDKARERVYKAIEQQEKILVYGDYDADGVSSTTVLVKALEELNANCSYYIPNRFTEGYGPNENAFTEAYKNGFTLIITVDTGIAAVHEAEIAKQLGIDLIITDHHEPQEELPDAFSILHPKCSSSYPFKDLAGVGVAFKFAQSLLGYFPKHLLEFVAIGTIADLVPLVEENRILAYFGLQALSQSKNPGIQALKKVCKIEGNVTEEDVGFSIGPRINAVGRLQDATLAVELLMTDDMYLAEDIAEEIEQINEQRKKIVNEIVEEAEKSVDPLSSGVIVVAKEGWNEGVLGIVASKLVRKYDRPAIVLTIKSDTNEAKGSARSIPAFDLFQHCMKVRELFINFGGHAQAAGMTLPIENVKTLENKLSEFIHQELTEEDFKQEIEISGKLSLHDIHLDLVKEITKLAPFGMNNPKPVFQIDEIPTEKRQIGAGKNHLKVLFKKDNIQLDGIGFGIGELYHYITPKTPIKIVGELGINEWNGLKKIQMMIQDMRIDDWQLFDRRGMKHVQYTPYHKKRVAVVQNEVSAQETAITSIPYNAYHENLHEVDVLYIRDLPNELNHLKEIIKKTQPKNIYACYLIEDSAYLKSFPSREDFAWYYTLLRKKKTLNLTHELKPIINAKGWSKDRIIFMSKVFSELDFVKITDGVLYCNPNPEKNDLNNSATYQKQLRQMEIEKTLYYSNYDELRAWFSNCMKRPKEEMAHGL